MRGTLRSFAIVFAILCTFAWGVRGILHPTLAATEGAEAQGYKDVVFIDRHDFFPGFYGCSHFDATAVDVTAVHPTAFDERGRRGVRDEYVICLNWPFQGAVVRAR